MARRGCWLRTLLIFFKDKEKIKFAITKKNVYGAQNILFWFRKKLRRWYRADPDWLDDLGNFLDFLGKKRMYMARKSWLTGWLRKFLEILEEKKCIWRAKRGWLVDLGFLETFRISSARKSWMTGWLRIFFWFLKRWYCTDLGWLVDLLRKLLGILAKKKNMYGAQTVVDWLT